MPILSKVGDLATRKFNPYFSQRHEKVMYLIV